MNPKMYNIQLLLLTLNFDAVKHDDPVTNKIKGNQSLNIRWSNNPLFVHDAIMNIAVTVNNGEANQCYR